MRLEIRQRGVKMTEELRGYLKDRLGQALGRFRKRIQLVRVYVRDVNGPRGGLDKKCRMVVELPLRASVVVTAADVVLPGAIARAASRAGMAVKRHLQRRQARRRPPRRAARRTAPWKPAAVPEWNREATMTIPAWAVHRL